MSTRYELRATLNDYAGNHERELTWWAFGVEDEYSREDRPLRPHAESMKWAYEDGEDSTIELFPHEEYGLVWERLDDLDPNTVIWHFGKKPSSEQWNTLQEVFKAWKGMSSPAQVRWLTLSRVETAVTEVNRAVLM